jgi:hypothetical protein
VIKEDPVAAHLHGTVNRAFESAGALILEPAFETVCAHPFSTQLFAQRGVASLVEILEERSKERLQAGKTVHRDNRMGHVFGKLCEHFGNKGGLANPSRTANQQAFSFAYCLMQPEAFRFAVDK